MSIPQKPQKAISFVDFVPAELRETSTWHIVYYVKDPASGELRRKRNRVKPLKSITERRKLGKRMVKAINYKLERGWNPFLLESESNGLIEFKKATEIFLNRMEKEVQNNDKRPDTLRSYKSFINNILFYIKEIGEENMFAIKFDEKLVRDFIDHIYYDRDNSARTRNNYLNFINTLSEWLIKHQYISKNPTARLEVIPNKKKQRIVIPDKVLEEIFVHLKNKRPFYFVLCQVCYYCLVRRTEMTKLKVRDVMLNNGILFIESDTAKNKKSLPVTIPNALIEDLARHIQGAHQSDYLFSDNLRAGHKQLDPKKISDIWTRVRNEMNLSKEYQWYSLKDTGITNLLKAGVPLISVRNQARHHSSSQTDAYTPKEILKANESIKYARI